jgi:hypothetical protein
MGPRKRRYCEGRRLNRRRPGVRRFTARSYARETTSTPLSTREYRELEAGDP